MSPHSFDAEYHRDAGIAFKIAFGCAVASIVSAMIGILAFIMFCILRLQA